MAHQQVVRIFDLFAKQPFALRKRDKAEKPTAFNHGRVDLFSSSFIKSIAIAGSDDARPTGCEMLLQVVSRKDTVAVGKQQIGTAARSHAVVPAACDPEALVRMTDPANGNWRV